MDAKHWLSAAQREEAKKQSLDRDGARWEEHTRELKTLNEGTVVSVQRMAGPMAKAWDRSGVIVEANKEFSQYKVRVDGSRRIILRNRANLKELQTSQAHLRDWDIPILAVESHTLTGTQSAAHTRPNSQSAPITQANTTRRHGSV